MSVSIRPCPSCDALLLGDTAQCPHCGEVFDKDRVSDQLDIIMADEYFESKMEEVCRQCGETVRIGLVRCWNCGGFMNPETEASYLDKIATASPQGEGTPQDNAEQTAGVPDDGEDFPLG